MKKFYLILWLSAITLMTASWTYENYPEKGKSFDTSVKAELRDLPVSFRMHDYLVKYAKQYKVPLDVAFGIAKLETSYGGAFHWTYNPSQTSYAAAFGAMQVQQPTATYVWGKEICEEELLYNFEFNIETSMKYISMLKNRYGSWPKALGYYHTGYPVINWYAEKITKGADLTI